MKRIFVSPAGLVLLLLVGSWITVPAVMQTSTPQIRPTTLSQHNQSPVSATPAEFPSAKIILVTTTADTGAGSLRRAIRDAMPGDTIRFDAAVFSPTNPDTIILASPLPELGQGNVTIDASDAGVILDSSQIDTPDFVYGLSISSSNNSVRGLQIMSFSGTGIWLHAGAKDNIIGGDRTLGSGPVGRPQGGSQQAVRFSGPGDFLEIPHSESLVPSKITIEAWIRIRETGDPNVANGEQTILDKRTGPTGYNLRLAGENFPLGIGAVFEPEIAWSVGMIRSQRWYHFAATQDSSAIRTYVDGKALAEVPNTYVPNSTSPLRIGEFLGYPSAYLGLRGELDEIRIWNYVRSQNEIQSTMYDTLSGTEPGLVAYWPFDFDSGTMVTDRSPNGNNGVLNGNAKLIASTAPIGFQPPPSPVGIRTMADEEGVIIRWKGTSDPTIASYNLYRGTSSEFVLDENSLIAAIPGSDSQYIDTSLFPGEEYFYRLEAIDRESHVSGPSAVALGRAQELYKDYTTGVYYYPWWGPENHIWPGEYLRDYLVIKQPPQLGHYSSRDASVIRQHFAWMEQHGIDFFVSSWWGQSGREDITLRDHILQELSGRQVKFSIYYELLKLGTLVNGEMVIDQNKEDELVSDFIYFADTYFSHPNFFKIDGRPVVFLYLFRTLTGNYVQAFGRIRAELQNRGYNLYLIGDEMGWHSPSPSRLQVLDAVSPYIMYGISQHDGYTMDVEFFADISRKAGEWYAASLAEGKDFIPNVHPGFNNRGIGSSAYAAPRQMTLGTTSTSSFEEYIRVMRSFVDPNLRMILITSWNEWHEDTQIEPTIVTASTNIDISQSGSFYTQGYEYEGYGMKNLEVVRDLLAGGLPTRADVTQPELPVRFFLHQNFPNPFNPSTVIRYSLPAVQAGLPVTRHVTLKVYNVLGQEIATLVNEELKPGSYEASWEAGGMASGVYVIRMMAGDYAAARRLVLLK